MQITDDIGDQREAFLELEFSASAAYNEFVYRDRIQADAIRGLLFDSGVAEFAQTFSRVLLSDDEPLGMISCLAAADLKRARMRCAYLLGKTGVLAADTELASRIGLAGAALMRLQPGDFYLSRIAVAPQASGRGLATLLLEHCVAQAREQGSTRIALEVAAANGRAISFYERAGFREEDRQAASDSSGRRLEYVHMTRELS